MIDKITRAAIITALAGLFASSSFLASTTRCSSLPAINVTPLINEQYFPSVHKALKGAKRSIFCVMFIAKVNARYDSGLEYILVKDLINAHKRGVEVTVIFDQNVQFWKKGWERNKIERKSETAYEMLLRAGVPVYYDDEDQITHSKVIVVDDLITIVGSTNWTYSALNKNHESSILVESEEVAREFTRRLRLIPKVRVRE